MVTVSICTSLNGLVDLPEYQAHGVIECFFDDYKDSFIKSNENMSLLSYNNEEYYNTDNNEDINIIEKN